MNSSFILESAQPILQEAEIIKSDPAKAIFRMVLQTADEINQNKRIYPRAVLEEAMTDCDSRMKRRAFFGELDHPFPLGNDTFDGIRQTTVSLECISHIIRDYQFKGNKLVGELETSTTPKGKILLALLKDKTGIGMSMRGLAELERKENYNKVLGPLTIIAFDAVSMPSHQAAIVDFNEMQFESTLITESCGLVCYNGKCFLPEYFDKLVENKVITFFEKWV
jgi:hypothetical protein